MHSVIVRDPALRRVMLAGLFLFFAAPLLFLNPTYALLGQETVLSIFNITIVILPIAAAALAVALWRSFSKGEILRLTVRDQDPIVAISDFTGKNPQQES